MKHILVLMIALLFANCTFNQINYPYAENNTTIYSCFDTILKDDYKWLESDCPEFVCKDEWIKSQQTISEKLLKKRKNFIYDRIHALGEIPIILNAGIYDNDIYYLKTNYQTKDVKFCIYSQNQKNRRDILDLDLPFLINLDMKVSLSPDKTKLAFIAESACKKYDLYIYDVTENKSLELAKIEFVNNYNVRWSEDNSKLFFLKDGISDMNDSVKSTYLCALSLDKKDFSLTRLLTNDSGKLFNTLDYAYDEINNVLYIAETLELNKSRFNMYSISPDDTASLKHLCSFKTDPKHTYRMGGVDSENIYFIKHNHHKKGELYSMNKCSFCIDTLMRKEKDPITDLCIVKDHIVVSYRNRSGYNIFFINNQTKELKSIEVQKEGRYKLLGSRRDSFLYMNHESFTSPKSLVKVSVNRPAKIDKVCEMDGLPFNSDNFITEYKSIEDKNGNNLNFTISYHKRVVDKGPSPTILFSFLNAGDAAVNSFYFSRILYMEQGFVYVQPRDLDLQNQIPYSKKVDDLKRISAFLIENGYTSRSKLCLSGREYGSTAIAQILNENPSFCKAVTLTDGIYDLISGNIRYDDLFNIETKDDFLKTLAVSPYQQIRQRKSYPSMLLITTHKYKDIHPAHTYKYVAKLQMRTKGSNPVYLYKPGSFETKSKLEYTDYYDNIYSTICFTSAALGLILKEEYISNPDS